MEEIGRMIERVKADLQDGKPDEEIFQFLVDHFGKDPEADRTLVEGMAAIAQEKIANLLQRMFQLSKEKKTQKIIKRSLYRLKSRGIAVEGTLPEERISILRPLRTELPKGFGGGFDFLGQRFLVLVVSHAGRGWAVMQGVISDTEGVIDFSGEEMTRKEFRRFFEEVREKSQFPLVELEPSYVGFLFSQAYQLSLKKKRVLPQEYLHLKSDIEGVKKVYERPLIYSFLQRDEIAGDDRVLGRGGELLNADVTNTWKVGEEEIRPYADEVWDAEESKIVLTQTQKEARFQGVYQKALSDLFTDERRFLYRRRLEEMAYVFLKLGKEEEAKISLAVAIDLEKPLNPIQPNPFLFQLVVKSIFTFLKEAYEKKVKEPSLIVKP
jgi:hypothetical protein